MMRRLHAASLAVCVACGSVDGGRADGRDSAARSGSVGASAEAPTQAGVELLPINRGTRGMRSTVRWVLSPDRSAILAVEDPVSVEAEALPDGFLYASERTGTILQLDNIWDVAPSPDWTRLAFGRAFLLRAGERDTLPGEEWQRLEAWLPEDVADRDATALRRRLKAHAFPVSGMSLTLGFGLAQVMWLDSLGSGRVPAPTGPTHSLHGWRVRWTMSGDTLAAGVAPRTVQDDALPTRWVLVRPTRFALYTDTLGATTDSTRFARTAWIDGPTMEIGSAVRFASSGTISIAGGTVESSGDSIRVTTRSASGTTAVRVLGPGTALAATANGRFILAIVPRANARDNDTRPQPVIYHIPATSAR